MAKRAFGELEKGNVVNLGIGIPTLVADLIKPEHGIILHTEKLTLIELMPDVTLEEVRAKTRAKFVEQLR